MWLTFIFPDSIFCSKFSILLIRASLLSSNIGCAIFIIVTSIRTLGFDDIFIPSCVSDNMFKILIKLFVSIVSACCVSKSIVSSGRDIISSKSFDILQTIKFLKWSIKSFTRFLTSFPQIIKSFNIWRDFLVSSFIIDSAKSNNCSIFTLPKSSITSL